MADKATVVEEKEEGGVVTTVKEGAETTKDLDVAEELAASGGGDEEAKAEEAKAKIKAAKPDEPSKHGLDMSVFNDEQKEILNKFFKTRRLERKEAKAAQAELDTLKARLEAVEAKSKEGSPAKVVDANPKPIRPDRDDFDEKAAYDEAMDTYEDSLHSWRQSKERAELAAREARTESAKTLEKYEEQKEEFRQEHPDFDDVMDSSAPFTPAMYGACLKYGPALGYAIMSDPKKYNQIYKLKGAEQVEALIELAVELKLARKSEKPEKGSKATEPTAATETRRHVPLTPTRGAGGAATQTGPADKRSFKEKEREVAARNPGLVGYQP